MNLNLSEIIKKQHQLSVHPLFQGNSLKSIDDLHIFMEHHCYAVWDFMSLIKALQHHVCPSTECWVPTYWTRAGVARFVNEIVLHEESDIDIDGTGTITHHDLYVQAMLEVGASGRHFEAFIENVRNNGFDGGLEFSSVPAASVSFMNTTFEFIDSQEPHIIAGAFCFGRETLIPGMFKSLLSQLEITEHHAPKFYYYINRHIEVDGNNHGPMSKRIVEILCNNDPIKIHEAEQAALRALDARIRLWDEVYKIITDKDSKEKYSNIFLYQGNF